MASTQRFLFLNVVFPKEKKEKKKGEFWRNIFS
jgi:hypothetical protein